MTRRSRPTGPACRLLRGCVAVGFLWLGLCCLGCNRPESPPGDAPEVPGKQPTAAEKPSADTPKQPPPDAPKQTPPPVQKEPAPGGSKEPAPVPPQRPVAARDILRRMEAAYKKAPSYADAGKVRLKAKLDEGEIDDSANLSVTLVRPNKIRLEIYQAVVVSDGKQLHAAILDLPGQVLAREAPEELTIKALYSDPILGPVLSEGIAGTARQLIFLLQDNPVDLLLEGATAALGKPGTIARRDYYRVEIKRTYGTTVFWIDQESYVLRRIVFPTEELRQQLSRYGKVESLSLVADLEGARLGGEVDAKAFQFEVPEGAELMKFFVRPQPAQLLGKKVPDFKFVDLEGKPVTRDSLAGKVTVLEFWATSCRYCGLSLPVLEKAYQKYKDNQKVAAFAVSVDAPEVENGELKRELERMGIHVPILRDPEQQMEATFRTPATPSRFVIDAKGVLQYVEEGIDPEVQDPDAALAERLEKLLAGEDIYQEPLEEYRKLVKQRQRRLEALVDAKIAERSEPKTFKLTPLWKCTELRAPGNILAVASDAGPPRLLVVDDRRSVAEVGLDGKLIATHLLEIDRRERIANLRSAVGADGKRYVAALAGGQQRFHLLDEAWNLVVSFPEDALETRHDGIADVQLADLDGDGTLEAYVGYRGVVGVQQVSLEGKRLWSNRSIYNVKRMAVSGPDAEGSRQLVCANDNSQLAVIHSSGQRLREATVAVPLLYWIAAADLTGDGQPEWCGLAAREDGDHVAMGLTLGGKELWSYPLPVGVHREPVELIVAGKLIPGGSGQWLLPGADGSIHVLAPDGKLLDQFNYGAALAGLATVELDGKPLLIVSTPDALEAWKAEPLSAQE